MAVIISNGATTLNTASGFYRVEADNLSCMHATLLALTTTRYINTTFANAGDCLGIVLNLNTVSITSRQVIASLEQYQSVTSFNTSTEKVNKVAHGLLNNDKVSFTTTGVLPTGITAGVQYYVIDKTDDDFQISTTLGGSAVGLSGTPSGTWAVGVERATKTLSTSDIAGEGMYGAYKYRGVYFTPFAFTAGYTVTTDVNLWRFRIAHGTGTGTWNLATSDATNPFYATWCDTAATFTDNDVVIVKDTVTIDKTATFGAKLGTGDAVYGISGVICSNPANPAPADVSLLVWENPPSAAYTLTVGGKILMAAYSGFRAGTSTDRIPIAQKATVTFTAPTAGTATAGFLTPTGTAANVYGGFSSLFLYGEIPAYQITTLKSNAVIAQADLVCNDSVDWVNGDQVVIGKQYTQGQGVTTIHTVSSVAGDTITLTANLATSDRKSGGTVIKLNSHGILMQNTGTYSSNSLFTAANIQISGADLYNQLFTTPGTTYYYYLTYLTLANRSQYLFQDVTFWTNSTSCTYLLTAISPPQGILMQRCYGFRQMAASGCVAFYTSLHRSERMTVKDSAFLGQYAATISTAANIRLTIDNCSFENARASTYFFAITGINSIFTNNKIWGSGTLSTTSGAVILYQAFSPVLSGNTYNYNACAFCIGAVTGVNCIDTDSIFGNEYANTYDMSWISAAFPDYTFKSNTGNLVFDETYLSYMIVGGRIGFTDFNNTPNDDRTIFTLGKVQRTGDSLTDPTVHTSGTGKFALRIEPLSSDDLFEWSFNIPTGDISTKTMTVAVWCKINTDTYYAGTHQNPRLTINYDDGTTTYAEATDSTSWQLLSVAFTPTTTYEEITVTVSTRTDATGSNAYTYFDDFDVHYPAGYALDLGTLDVWADALPITPPILIGTQEKNFNFSKRGKVITQ